MSGEAGRYEVTHVDLGCVEAVVWRSDDVELALARRDELRARSDSRTNHYRVLDSQDYELGALEWEELEDEVPA